MNKENCCMIKDLLPLYIDGLCSDDTNEIIKDHLSSCKDCKNAYDAMRSEVPGNDYDHVSPLKMDPDTSDLKLIEKVSHDVKQKANRSGFIAALAVILAVFIVLGSTVPIVPVSKDDIKIELTCPRLMADGEPMSYYDISQQAVVVYEQEKDLSECSFMYVVPDREYYGMPEEFCMAVDVEYLNTDDSGKMYTDMVKLIDLSSTKQIKSYKTDVSTSGTGEVILTIKDIRTSLFSGTDDDITSRVTILNTDGINAIKLEGSDSYITVR